jgi:hypothetical protein
VPDRNKSPPDSNAENADDIREGSAACHDGVVESVSRSVGEIARSVSDRLKDAAALFAPPPPRRRRRQVHEESVSALLERLGELVSAHGSQGYASLEDNRQFWELIARLRRARGRILVKRKVARRPPAADAEIQDATLEEESGAKLSERAPEKGGRDPTSAKPVSQKKRREKEASAGATVKEQEAAEEGKSE